MNLAQLKSALNLSWNFLADIIFPPDEILLVLESLSAEELSLREKPQENSSYPALFSYKDPLIRRMVWALKYRGNAKIASIFGELIREAVLEDISEMHLFKGESKILLLPIPSSKSKLNEKGYNQSEILCRKIAEGYENIFDFRTDILTKIKETSSQTKSATKKERFANLSGSFLASSSIKNRVILIVDDVTTTGATFDEAKRACLEKEAGKILCQAIAH